MEFVKICGIILCAVMAVLILKEQSSSFKFYVAMAGTVVAFFFAVNTASPVIEYMKEIGSFDSGILKILLQVLGISYLTDFASSLCKDTGETSLAFGVDLCGKAEILIVGLPIFKELVKLCTTLMN